MDIPVQQARGIFTQALIDVYNEMTTPTQFLRSFFKVVESNTKLLSIEVRRGKERVAVDVSRGTEGNRNTFSRSTQKIFLPPFYREFFDATELDIYDRLFTGNGSIDENTLSDFVKDVAEKMRDMQNLIDRAYELQCSQVFQTGIVSLNKGTNIDFKRKAASLVAVPDGGFWDSNDPFATFEQGALFLRQVGKAQGGIFNSILGSEALAALYANDEFKDRAKWVNISLDIINPPQRNSVGAMLHGLISIGSYKSYIWSYPEFYDDVNGISTAYIGSKKLIMLAENPHFTLGFAAVPQLLRVGNAGATPQTTKGAYIVSEYLDERNSAHIFDLKSAGVAIPTAVDQIWTANVLS